MAINLAVQMFTLRDYTTTREGLADALKKISDIGYEAVQLSAVKCMQGDNPEVDVNEAKQMLDDNRLKCIATHRPWDNLMNNTEEEIAFHKELDCGFCAIGGIPNTYGHTAEGYRQFLKEAAPVIEKLKAAGIQFGHHNHSKEFNRISRHGPWLEDILIDEGPSDLMIELDLYWAHHGGVNCERVIEKCHGRMPVIHLKDKGVQEPGQEPSMFPIGEGNMDWDHLIPACKKAGVEYYAVELDNYPRDPFDCLESSFQYLQQF